MNVLDLLLLGLSMSMLSFFVIPLVIFSAIVASRHLLPRNIVPRIAAVLNETLQLLDRAEAISAIPDATEYRTSLANLVNRFQELRTASHRHPRVFQQLRLAFLCDITYRLYSLSSKVEAIKMQLELAVDIQHLASFTTKQSANPIVLSNPAIFTVVTEVDPPQGHSEKGLAL